MELSWKYKLGKINIHFSIENKKLIIDVCIYIEVLIDSIDK